MKEIKISIRNMNKIYLDKIKSDFNKNGYYILKNFYNAKKCNDFLKLISKYATINYPPIMNPDRSDFLISQSIEKLSKLNSLYEKTLFLKKLEKDAKDIKKFMFDKKIFKVLNFIKGKKVDPLMSQMIFKKASSKFSKQSWQPHQDNSYPKNKNGHYITTNVFLNKSTKKNGTLYVWESSHKYGIFNFGFKKSYREKDNKPGNIVKTKKKFNVKILNFNKGDLLILHGNCVHGSYPNNSKTSRPLYSVSYLPIGEKFISGKNAQRKRLKL